MTDSIRILAVGDILMWGSQIASARTKTGYDFKPMFASVRPILRSGDLTIGNLETPLAGREKTYQQTNPKTKFPEFNCPDELAGALKWAGFDVLTTANNHCMDRGEAGLRRTLGVLDRAGLQHTGTFASASRRQDGLVIAKNGIRVGILSYTYGTNGIPVPKERSWLVNRINLSMMAGDIQRIRRRSDVVVVCVHFGSEFHRKPNDRQKNVSRALLRNGADIVLGVHPHVVQPIVFGTTRRTGGSQAKTLVCYSLGNFISDRMFRNPHTQSGVIVGITVKKSAGKVSIERLTYLPTWTCRRLYAGRRFRVLPIRSTLARPNHGLASEDVAEMKRERLDTLKHLNAHVETKPIKG